MRHAVIAKLNHIQVLKHNISGYEPIRYIPTEKKWTKKPQVGLHNE